MIILTFTSSPTLCSSWFIVYFHSFLWQILDGILWWYPIAIKLYILKYLCSCHVTYAFQSERTLYSCLNVKELLARSRHEIWRLSDSNWIRTQNHLVHKRILNHLVKWLSVRLWTNWIWVRIQLQSLKYLSISTKIYQYYFYTIFQMKLTLQMFHTSAEQLFFSSKCFYLLIFYLIFFQKKDIMWLFL